MRDVETKKKLARRLGIGDFAFLMFSILGVVLWTAFAIYTTCTHGIDYAPNCADLTRCTR